MFPSNPLYLKEFHSLSELTLSTLCSIHNTRQAHRKHRRASGDRLHRALVNMNTFTGIHGEREYSRSA